MTPVFIKFPMLNKDLSFAYPRFLFIQYTIQLTGLWH
jgi:hypothetical protein